MSDRYRFITGYTVIIGMIVLAATFGHGAVEEKTSYGLVPILGILGKVALDFSQWAYTRVSGEKGKDE